MIISGSVRSCCQILLLYFYIFSRIVNRLPDSNGNAGTAPFAVTIPYAHTESYAHMYTAPFCWGVNKTYGAADNIQTWAKGITVLHECNFACAERYGKWETHNQINWSKTLSVSQTLNTAVFQQAVIISIWRMPLMESIHMIISTNFMNWGSQNCG
jgi:hypothetical protein